MAEEKRELQEVLAAQEKAVREWGKMTTQQLKRYLLAAGVHDQVKVGQGSRSGQLYDSVGYALRKRDGEVEAISLKFQYYGIFLEHGVGKNRRKGTPASKSAAKPWLSITIPGRIEILATMLAEATGDGIARELRFTVPGILDTRVNF